MLAYPLGAPSVRCPICETITQGMVPHFTFGNQTARVACNFSTLKFHLQSCNPWHLTASSLKWCVSVGDDGINNIMLGAMARHFLVNSLSNTHQLHDMQYTVAAAHEHHSCFVPLLHFGDERASSHVANPAAYVSSITSRCTPSHIESCTRYV